MSLWSRIAYSCTEYCRLSKVNVYIEVKSQSDNTMVESEYNIPVEDTTLHDLSYDDKWNIRRSISKENGDFFNDMAQMVLKDIKAMKVVIKNCGILIPGDYLVAADWRVSLDWHKLTYKEYITEVWNK